MVRCRVAQGADAAGEVWTRVSVEDMTLVVDARTATTRPSSAPPDATGHPPAAHPNRDQDASARAGTLEVRQLAPLPTLACAAALTDAAGVTLHAHRDVFAIPGTARADAIAADALGAHPTQIVVSNRDVKRLTVFDVALAASEKRPTLVATPVRTVVLGIAHPALELARFGDDVVAGTPRGYARANLVDGFAEALAPMRRDATFVDDARARRVARRLEIRRPTKEPYDSMFRDGFEADGHERDDEFERDEENREDAIGGRAIVARPDARRVGRRRGPESKPGRGLLFLGAGRGGIAREVRRARPRREFRRERYRYLGASRARRWRLFVSVRVAVPGGCSLGPARTPSRARPRASTRDDARRDARRSVANLPRARTRRCCRGDAPG